MIAALPPLPRGYLSAPGRWTIVGCMPTIVLEDTPSARRAHQIASLLHSANVLDAGGMLDAAKYLRVKAAALKHGVPDGCESFSDEDDETRIEIVLETP